VSGGFRVLTSDAPAEDTVVITSGPLLAASARDCPGACDAARQQAARQLTELRASLAPPRQPPGTPVAGSLTIGQFLTGLSGYLAGWTGSPWRGR
jgi:hypothetical protein